MDIDHAFEDCENLDELLSLDPRETSLGDRLIMRFLYFLCLLSILYLQPTSTY